MQIATLPDGGTAPIVLLSVAVLLVELLIWAFLLGLDVHGPVQAIVGH
jgi:hypothetical protein